MNAKIASYKEFSFVQSSQNPWNVVYKFCRRDGNLNNTLQSVDTGNGYTKTPLETAEVLMNSFFPQDNEDTIKQMQVWAECKTDLTTGDDVEFTEREIATIIGNQNDKKAPGFDSISANIIKHVFHVFPSLFVQLYNKCLKLGVFPNLWKIGVIKIIPKQNSGNDQYTANKLRPITLLSLWVK